ncbi:DNA-protecting protein DprA [Schaalia sp. ZJ405]|uniref:DNA-processing protein DprA n=1 Tax=Schaalia sp. ZJ405 TaxID=2709403 RepID=UPI0013EAB58D|nr:DNA-processing protein DprA [Schaalia sp. ZJ405]QPK81997.1 DNA-protecting protein DprA [Schaalia sp. ZJ405]
MGQIFDDAHIHAAWWTGVIEPGDLYASALRAALGDEEARLWAQAKHPGPLPTRLLGPNRDWEGAWKKWHSRIDGLDAVALLEQANTLGHQLVIPSDQDWPRVLSDLGPTEPVGLWISGTLPASDRCISIVGARAATQRGEMLAADIACSLAERGWAVISGGAFGIDIAAHRGCRAGEGQTVVVLAGGISHVYPVAHADDFRCIQEGGGALVSEVPAHWRPAKWRFLGRNRLIAAWGRGTVVVEAGMRSGALATARRAMELGRPVGAVPGPVESALYTGCHELIRHGATLIRDADDCSELIEPMEIRMQQPLFGDPVTADHGTDGLAPTLRRIWEALPMRQGTSISRVARVAGLSQDEVLRGLAELELLGYVRSGSGGYRRNPRYTSKAATSGSTP